LLIVVCIVGVLVGAAGGVYHNYTHEARRTHCLQDMDTIAAAAARFESLENAPALEIRLLLGRYLETLEPDPWGNPYYVLLGAVHSRGPDGIAGTSDDIVKRYKSYPDKRHQAWDEVRLLVRMIKGALGDLTDILKFCTFFIGRNWRIPFDPWSRPYVVIDGWVASIGPTGTPGKPGGAWAWAGPGPAPRGPNGESLEVPTGVPPEDQPPPFTGMDVVIPPIPEVAFPQSWGGGSLTPSCNMKRPMRQPRMSMGW
jgi:hypothetical protein